MCFSERIYCFGHTLYVRTHGVVVVVVVVVVRAAICFVVFQQAETTKFWMEARKGEVNCEPIESECNQREFSSKYNNTTGRKNMQPILNYFEQMMVELG